MLEHRARRLGVADHVIFHDRFVSQEELVDFLAAGDLYVTPDVQPRRLLRDAGGAFGCREVTGEMVR
jgi:glycosyltransferase involved in cell wall biosynthesis